MEVLSLFDGISALRLAMHNINIPVDRYYSSEIDKFAIKISKKNWSDIEHVGDVKNIFGDDYFGIDLICGGSPCQDLSSAKGKREGLCGAKSSLFWEYLRIIKEAKPKFFIFENVASMHKRERDKITKALGVKPVLLNSANFSAQMRSRYFWCNFKINPSIETNTENLQDVLENGLATRDKANACTASYRHISNSIEREGRHRNLVYLKGNQYRKLIPVEYERLQKFPDNYTDCVSNSQRYKAVGNSFTITVIEHILLEMQKNIENPQIDEQLTFSYAE